MLKLADEVRSTRRALGLSQAALAAAAGVSLATVQNVEAGTANPSQSTLRSLLAPLGLRLEVWPETAHWEALISLGLPLSGGGASGLRRDGSVLADHVRRAALELSRPPGTPGGERKRESLQALLLAIRTHFPARYRAWFGWSDLIRQLLPEKSSGRQIKLARLARAALAEYL